MKHLGRHESRIELVRGAHLCLLLLLCQGCGTVAGYECNTNRHLLHVTRLADGSPAVGISLLDWGALDWTTMAAGLGADIAAGIGAYQLYEAKHPASSASAQNAPPPVTISVQGNGNTVNMKRGSK